MLFLPTVKSLEKIWNVKLHAWPLGAYKTTPTVVT